SSATTGIAISIPQPPTGLTASAISSSQINLSWIAPTNNGGAPITGYKIERSTDSGSTWSTIVSNTVFASTTYSNNGLTASTTYTYRISAINSVGTGQASVTASATTQNEVHSITQVGSGLVITDSLTNETKTQQQLQNFSRYWAFGGDAPAFGAQYDFFKNPQGLHIGAETKANGTWAGYFAESPNTNATLFHAVITTPLNFLPYEYFENGMYIQTSQPFINYVTCTSVTSQFGTVWAVVSTIGNATQANQFNVLYVDPSSNQPLTRDCTIITNGNNYLKVYLDGTMVYSNSTLNLQMPKPFNTYLEPQSSYHGQLLNGTYTNYYATTNEIVKITNLTNNIVRTDLVDNTGKILASSHPSNGIASFDVGKYDFPLAANIKAYDANNILIASTSNIVKIYGGDVYSSH
ncbi:MAG TPA: fibronectin type III domain-containing protein, partial [Candidatus Nitrosotalea sp.]|nr:fibronectin type III domain-containing protein [Candidatus Nitrosotalea sp.]